MKNTPAHYFIAFCIILFLNFLLPRIMPGDPLMAIYGEEVLLHMPASMRENLINSFGLNQPVWKQFLSYILCLVKGNLGYSYYYKVPVVKLLLAHLPWTMFLMVTSLIVSTIFGVVLGIESGWRRGKKFDTSLLFGMMSFSGFPSFFIGILFLLLFSLSWGIFPLQGAQTAYAGLTGVHYLLDILRHAVLPLTSLIIVYLSGNYLLTRTTMIMTIKEPYILTAKAKGLTDRCVRYKHAGKNSLLPVVTMTGVRFGSMIITGALFIEIVYSYPGIGLLLYNSLLRRDYPVLQGILLIVTILVLFAHPSRSHFLGTNDVGQDIWSRLLWGTGTSLFIAFGVGFLCTVLSTFLGISAGLIGGIYDKFLMRMVDAMLAIPIMVVLIVITAFLKPNALMLILLISLLHWQGGARVVRAQTLSLKNRMHILAAQNFGAGKWYLIFRHIIPELGPILWVSFIHSARMARLKDA